MVVQTRGGGFFAFDLPSHSPILILKLLLEDLKNINILRVGMDRGVSFHAVKEKGATTVLITSCWMGVSKEQEDAAIRVHHCPEGCNGSWGSLSETSSGVLLLLNKRKWNGLACWEFRGQTGVPWEALGWGWLMGEPKMPNSIYYSNSSYLLFVTSSFNCWAISLTIPDWLT